MKRFKKSLAFLLILCMIFSAVPLGASAADGNGAGSKENQLPVKMLHLDCGRKYFSADWIIALIHEISADGYTHLQLAFGNDGLRFLLDDLSLSVTLSDNTTAAFTGQQVQNAIRQGNDNYYADPNGNALTQEEMDRILEAAKQSGISVVPLLNTPGHMDALLYAANTLLGKDVSYGGSVRTVDVTNTDGVRFTQALVKKYIDYFASRGAAYFNLGADEYANDVYTSGGMGFGQLEWQGQYGSFVTYLNEMIDMVNKAGMVPMAFNDGVYYNRNESAGTIDPSLVVQYWSSGWSGYNLAPADYLAAKGFRMINFNGDYYYVLGKNDNFDNGYLHARNFDNTRFSGSTVSDPIGSAFAIWCDYPGAESEREVARKTRLPMRAMGKAMHNQQAQIAGMDESPVPFGFNADGTIDDGFSGPDGTETRQITLTVGQTVTDTILGKDYSGETAGDRFVDVRLQHETGGNGRYEKASRILEGQYIIEHHTSGELLTNQNGSKYSDSSRKLEGQFSQKPAQNAIWTIRAEGTGYTIQDQNGKYLNISDDQAVMSSKKQILELEENGDSWTISGDQAYLNRRSRGGRATGKEGTRKEDGSQWNLYRKNAGEERTVVSFTGRVPGTTEVQVGHVRYIIRVEDEPVIPPTPTDDPLTIEYWITNARPSENENAGKHELVIQPDAPGVNTESGVEAAALLPATVMNPDRNRTLEYWRCRMLDTEKRNGSSSGTEQQTTKNGDDETFSGLGFTRVRYRNGGWQVFTDSWVNVDTRNQLVAYYMEIVDIKNQNGTTELHVNAADWGTKGDGSQSWGYNPEDDRCSVSVQLVYEDNNRNPAGTTAEALKSKTIVYGYWKDGRGLGTMKFDGGQDFTIYKITAETGNMQSRERGTYVEVTDFEWNDNEREVWAGTPAQYAAIHNAASNPSRDGADRNLMWDVNRSGGQPGNNAILIRVYVKAAIKEDSLKVHYIDRTSDQEFYQYGINVAEGEKFHENFGLNAGYTDINQALHDNTVIDFYTGAPREVSANLATMPEIGAEYRYSAYKCVDARRSADGKDVYIYYTFTNAHHYVIDFGTPFDIEQGSLGILGDTGSIVGARMIQGQYGRVTASGTVLTYTPTRVLQESDRFSVELTIEENPQTKATQTVTHYIYVHPASNVLYEENFLHNENGSGWNSAARDHTKQSADNAVPYGFDSAYENLYGENGVFTATLQPQELTTSPLTFRFTGTGLDVIGTCGPATGMLVVRISQGGTTVKSYVVDTSFTNGSIGEIYQVPLVHVQDLPMGSYDVELSAANISQTQTASVMSVGARSRISPELYGILAQLGLSDGEIEQTEFVGMNDPLTVSTFAADSRVRTASAPAGVQTVSVDGFRVYRPADNPAFLDWEQNLVYTNILDAVSSPDNSLTAFVEQQADGTWQISDYEARGGPENEIYLAPGQAIAVKKEGTVAVPSLRSVETGKQVQAVLIDSNSSDTGTRGIRTAAYTVTGNMELYYGFTGDGLTSDGSYVLIKNAGADGLLAIGNIKTQAPLIQMTQADYPVLLSLLNTPEEPEVSTDFEVFFELGSPEFGWTDGAPAGQVKHLTVTEGAAITAPDMDPGADHLFVCWQAQGLDLTLEAGQALTAEELEVLADWTGADRTVTFRPVVEELQTAFTPEHFEISVSDRRSFRGRTVRVTVEASQDVAYITVNGTRVNPRASRWFGWRAPAYQQFETRLRLGRNEEVNLAIVAYDHNGNASDVYHAGK